MNVFEVICTGTLEAWHPIPLSSQKLSGTPGKELAHLKMKHETFRHLSSHRHLSTGRPVCLDMKQGAINQLFLRKAFPDVFDFFEPWKVGKFSY